MNQFWDEAVFINQKHRLYHKDYFGRFSIIPNLKEVLKPSDKTGLEKIAGVIGTFDENKQTHVSIKRALADGCEKVYLFGEASYPYYENFIRPLLSDKVIQMGFTEDKQAMYDAFVKETKVDLISTFDQKTLTNPVTDIVDSYFILKSLIQLKDCQKD